MLADKEECTGCMVCAIICPQKCISEKADEFGFFYPLVDEEKCIRCGKCSKICPGLNNVYSCKQIRKEPLVFAGWYKAGRERE